MELLCCSFRSSLYIQRLLRSSWRLTMMIRTSSNDSKFLPLSEIPGPKGTIRNCFDYALSKDSHFDFLKKRFERFGPIYSEKILSMRVVNISDADAITKVLRTEKAFQMRPGLEALSEIADNYNGLRLASNDYDAWYSDRSLLSPKLMRPKDISELLPLVNTATNDFMEQLHFRVQSGGTVNNFEKEITIWSVEASASFLFNQRLGLYSHPPDPTVLAFADVGLDMVTNISKLFYTSPLNPYIKTPAYYQLKKNFATIQATGMSIVDKLLATKKEREKDSSKQSVFEYFVANGRDARQSMASIVLLMVAGIDSTSSTCLWLLYLLSQHPDTQEKLYQELVTSLGPDGEVTASNIPSFLKAVLKESQRMYPVVGYIIARVFDKDLDILGYRIPSGVNILLHEHLASLDERYYGEDAHEFVPERALRDETGKIPELNPFVSLPFGFGVRMCLGRRIAESLIYTLISKILLRYRLEYAGEGGVNRSLNAGLMKPDRPVVLKFIPRA